MSPPAILSIFMITSLSTSLFIISITTASAAIADGSDKTVYEALQDYDFPVGLLPQGAENYELDAKTGRFKVFLKDSSCSFSIKGYHLRYKSTISGIISNDRIRNLRGISVKVLRLWFGIGEINRRDDKLEFSAAGIASANFAVTTFAKSPQCGCGFKCGSTEVLGIRKFNFSKPLLKLYLFNSC